MNLNRRHLLRSLAAIPVCSSIGQAYPIEVPKSDEAGNEVGREGHWLIAQQDQVISAGHGIDFWSKPLCDISHADHLPTEIVRGALWYDNDVAIDFQRNSPLAYVASLLKQDRPNWIKNRQKFVEHCGETKNLATPLLNIVGQRASNWRGGRTALLALDSFWLSPKDPDWADMLAAFRRCYDRVIGLFHIERRGFCHWKDWLMDDSGESYFEQYFSKPATLCDAVILTSPSLLENDTFLSARASTEALIGKLIERLGHALLDEYALEWIAPLGKQVGGIANSKPRVFALGSAASTRDWPLLQERDLARQCELVFSSFGKPLSRPLLIATQTDDISAEIIRNQFIGTNMALLQIANANRLPDRDPLEWNEFITLWPFDPDYGPWP